MASESVDVTRPCSGKTPSPMDTMGGAAQAMVQLIQQWLSTNRKSRNLTVAESMMLDASIGLQYKLKDPDQK